MEQSGNARGKIILTGEYAVLFGHPGIAVPSGPGIGVTLADDRYDEDFKLSWDADWRWCEYAEKIVKLCEAHTGKDITGNMTVKCSLPLGKGMGSSTALLIAICRCILGEDYKDFALSCEDTMNPGHSGLDFTVIWHEKPVYFRKGQEPEFISLDESFLQNVEFMDTGTPDQQTPEMVTWVKSREAELQEPLRKIAECTERLKEGKEPLSVIIRDHHRAQVALGVVPPDVQKKIAELEAQGKAAKVIGAGGRTGGGGMVLVVPGNV